MPNLDTIRESVRDAENTLAAFDAANIPGPTDPGSHSYRKHLTPRQADRDINRSLNAYKRQAEARDALVRKVAKARAELQEAERPGPVDPATIKGAYAVRDQFGWHKVIKVNAKTVTVATPYSWTDRIPLDKITAVRHPENTSTTTTGQG